LNRLLVKNIHTKNITLHVGAGTFKPVTTPTMEQHEMHAEWIEVDKTLIEQLIQHSGHIVATGTTSVRTLESLYWLGAKAFNSPHAENLSIQQWDAYSQVLQEPNLSTKEALQSLLKWLEVKKKNSLFTQTQLLIAPGYAFKVVKAMITNFHQPHSTLLLLVAAAVGKDWKKIYEYALENDFRFLSYGDSSLLFMVES
jgi:S-adenosylmethionine:tRNA ribosyltransferase-isomerase